MCAYLLAAAARADLIVPANSQTSLNSGVVDLACTDVVISGTLNVNSGSLKNVRNITIQPGGVVNGGSGVIEVGGNWSNGGTFATGTSTVNFGDLCGAGPTTISSNSTFFAVTFVSTIGRNFIFAVGSTQTITSLLQISGTQPNPIQFRSSAPGQVASINLLNNGIQQIQHVGVTDVWATGQCLAPGQTNEGGGGNARNWFICVPIGGGHGRAAIPTVDTGMLIALATLLAASGMWLSRRATSRRKQSVQRRADAARDEDRP